MPVVAVVDDDSANTVHEDNLSLNDLANDLLNNSASDLLVVNDWYSCRNKDTNLAIDVVVV